MHTIWNWICNNPWATAGIIVALLGVINGMLDHYYSAAGRAAPAILTAFRWLVDLLSPVVSRNASGTVGTILRSVLSRPGQGSVKIPLLQQSAPPDPVRGQRLDQHDPGPGPSALLPWLLLPLLALSAGGCQRAVDVARMSLGTTAAALGQARTVWADYDLAHQRKIVADNPDPVKQQSALDEYRAGSQAKAVKAIDAATDLVLAGGPIIAAAELGVQGNKQLNDWIANLLAAAQLVGQAFKDAGLDLPSLLSNLLKGGK